VSAAETPSQDPWLDRIGERPKAASDWVLDLIGERPRHVDTDAGELRATLPDHRRTGEQPEYVETFNRENTWGALLAAKGWQLVSVDRQNGNAAWRRPTKDRGESSATVYADNDTLTVFSTNAPLPPGTYDKIGFVVRTDYGGDFAAFGRRHGTQPAERIDPRSLLLSTNGAPASSDDDAATVLHRDRFKSGSQFVLDDPADLSPLWGTSDAVVWQAGEPLLIVGPSGVGKTTLALQILAARVGVLDLVLGWPVVAAESPVLYVAMDRPNQIRRAMRRVFGDRHRDALDKRLIVWEGPLPADMGRTPEVLVELATKVGAGTVFLDSLKDAVVKLTDDESAGNYNRGVQWAIAEGIDVCGLHHQRKSQNGTRPTSLEDVYGNTWITAGAGSVVLLWGAAGDPLVDLHHLKQPADMVGPLKIEHDHDAGISSVYRGAADPLVMLRRAPGGLTASDIARVDADGAKVSDVARKRAQRKLDRLVNAGLARRDEGVRGGPGGTEPHRYFAVDIANALGGDS
jgi:hypothetical protein